VSLLSSLLGEEEETLAGVGGPGGVLVGSLGLLATEVAGEVLGLDSVSAEEEELLLEDQAPTEAVQSAHGRSKVRCIDDDDDSRRSLAMCDLQSA
jgi:hypothetical protein